MKLRDLDILFKLKRRSSEFLASQLVVILHHSLPDDYIDEEAIKNLIDAGSTPSDIVSKLTQATRSSANVG